MVLATGVAYHLECWKLDYNTALINADIEEEMYIKMAPGYDESDESGVPMAMTSEELLWSSSEPIELVGDDK